MENKFQHGAGARGYNKPANIPSDGGTQRGQTQK